MEATGEQVSRVRTASFRTPSGEVVRLSGRTADLSEPWFCWVELVPDGASASPRGTGERRGFMVGPRSVVDAAVPMMNGAVRERVAYAGGTFVVVDGPEQCLGAWTGPWHAVYGWFDLKATTSALLGHFSGLSLTDTREGVRIRAAAERFGRTLVIKQIPGVGLVQMMKGAEAVSLLPSWSGARVAAGEVWRKAAADPDDHIHEHYVLASPSAVAIVHTAPAHLRFEPTSAQAAVDEDRLALGFLTDLDELSWGAR